MGYSRKTKQGVGVVLRTYIFEPPPPLPRESRIFRFFILPLEIQYKTKLHP